MVESGDWITPTLNGEPRFAKPVFIYWLMSGAYHMMGVSEFTARFPSALFLVLLIVLQYAFLSFTRNAFIGLLGGLMLLSHRNDRHRTYGADRQRINLLHHPFSLWLLDRPSRTWQTAPCLLVVLRWNGPRHVDKGSIGLVVTILGSLPYLIVTRRWKQFWSNGFPLFGLTVFALIALPWYGAMFSIHGARYSAWAQSRYRRPILLTSSEATAARSSLYFPVFSLDFFHGADLCRRPCTRYGDTGGRTALTPRKSFSISVLTRIGPLRRTVAGRRLYLF